MEKRMGADNNYEEEWVKDMVHWVGRKCGYGLLPSIYDRSLNFVLKLRIQKSQESPGHDGPSSSLIFQKIIL